jgi:hypothetical protein
VCQFYARERDGCRPEGFQGKHGGTTLLDGSVILFDNVVEVPTATDQDRPAAIFLA